jgi:hypothetical protein
MRAICYPHAGLCYSHTWILKEWFCMMYQSKGSVEPFFEWAEAYRKHCDALPVFIKGAAGNDLAHPELFTKDMFIKWAETNIRAFNKSHKDNELLRGYATEGHEAVEETLARITNRLYHDAAILTLSQFLAPLLKCDVYLPKETTFSPEIVVLMFDKMCLDTKLPGILSQKEDRPYRQAMTLDRRWEDPSYVFTDPLSKLPEGTPMSEGWPMNYDQAIVERIQLLTDEVRSLEMHRQEMQESKRTKKPQK